MFLSCFNIKVQTILMISIIIYKKKSFAKNQASSVFIYLC